MHVAGANDARPGGTRIALRERERTTGAMMKLDAERIGWAAVATGAAYVAGWALEKAARRGWESVTGEEPPEHPESLDTGWRDALLWTAATSLTLGVGQLLTRRLTAAGWQKLSGHSPV
jgi:hypothetical protein